MRVSARAARGKIPPWVPQKLETRQEESCVAFQYLNSAKAEKLKSWKAARVEIVEIEEMGEADVVTGWKPARLEY